VLQNFHAQRIVRFYSKNKQNCTSGANYNLFMTDDEALAHNLKRLMDYHNHKQKDVARVSGVSQKNISNILNKRAKMGVSLGQIGSIASAYKITTWHLLIPNCPDELLFNRTIEKLVENYANNDDVGRNATLSVSEIRAQHLEESKQKVGSKN
jgi:transcriptional regulator with XRE-family HTH domain